MDREAFGIVDVVPDMVEKLGDGRVLTRFPGGLSVVAGEHTGIVFEERQEDDRQGEVGIIIEPPDLDVEGLHHAAALYQATGRSPEADRRAARFTAEEAQAHAASAPPFPPAIRPMAATPGAVYDSGRIEIDDGVSASASTTVCPATITININDPNRFFAQWNGTAHDESPGVVVHTAARVPNGRKSGFRYKIYEVHSLWG